MDRLTSMAVFIRAVERGSFAGAAEAFGLSAPMVGKHVRFLEERLGVRLINRTTRRQSLTEFGRAYYERCKLVLAEADSADALADDLLGVPRGPLRVSMPVLFGRRCVAPVLLKLAQQHAGLELNLSFSDRPVDLIEDGFDLAIRNGHVDDSAGLMVRRVARQDMVVCASPAYIAQRGEPRDLAQLGDHDGIIYSRSGRARPWLFPRPDGIQAEVVPHNRLRLDDLEAIVDAAVAGMGLAWVPSWLIRDRLRSGTLLRVMADHPGMVFPTQALWLHTPHMPLRLRLAIDAVAAGLPGIMG